jgi:hypothetical protein
LPIDPVRQDYGHDGSTRAYWTKDVLTELNNRASDTPDLPSLAILQVIDEMFVPYEFDKHEKVLSNALNDLNELIKREGLEAYFDESQHCRLRFYIMGR